MQHVDPAERRAGPLLRPRGNPRGHRVMTLDGAGGRPLDTRHSDATPAGGPPDAAARIVTAIEKRRPRLLIGWSARIPDVLARLLPGTCWRLVAGSSGRPAARTAR
jgi:hypothetical protein